MGQRNMMPTSQMIDLHMDRHGQRHVRHDPCIPLGNSTHFPQTNIHAMLPASGNASNVDVHHIPQRYDGAVFYGMSQYNGFHHHHPSPNLDLAVAPPASNFYNPYVTPSSGTGVFPFSLNHGSPDQLPSSSNHGVVGFPRDEYGSNGYFMDAAVRGSCKRKNDEGIPGNFQYFNASASSSSLVAPMSMRHLEYGVSVMDAATYVLPQYRGNGTPSIMEVGSHRSVSNRTGAVGLDPVLAHSHNHLAQGNYPVQPFQPAGSPWLDQQLSSNGGDGGTLIWNQAPAVPYLHGSNVYGSSSIHHRRHNLHHPPPPPPPMLGVRSQDHQQVVRPQHLGPILPTGVRIYRSPHGDTAPEATPRYHNLPHLRVIPADEVAMLEISGFYEVRDFIDHHRDMRMDVEDMSYEELLALGEWIGNVNTGLSEDTIRSHLKTRTYKSSATFSNLQEAPCENQETDSCIICQCDYEDQEEIGVLGCRHEYHADCLKKWLLVKNVCPICKSSALAVERKDV